jgi:hypothetical protein
VAGELLVRSRIFQLRAAIKAAGGGHELARQASLALPWAGIFRPRGEAWRPLVLVAAAAEAAELAEDFHRPEQPTRERIQTARAARRRNRSQRLQDTQLELFPADRDQHFYRPAPAKIFELDPDRPLADVFPMAYLEAGKQKQKQNPC